MGPSPRPRGLADDLCVSHRRRAQGADTFSFRCGLASEAPSADATVFTKRGTKPLSLFNFGDPRGGVRLE